MYPLKVHGLSRTRHTGFYPSVMHALYPDIIAQHVPAMPVSPIPDEPQILLTQSRIVSPIMATLALLLLPSVVLPTWSSIPVLQVLMSMIPLCVSCFLICALLRGRVSSLHMVLPQRSRKIPCCFCRNCLTQNLPLLPLCSLKSISLLNVLDVKKARLLMSLLTCFVSLLLRRIPVLSRICWLSIFGLRTLNLS